MVNIININCPKIRTSGNKIQKKPQKNSMNMILCQIPLIFQSFWTEYALIPIKCFQNLFTRFRCKKEDLMIQR